jgi:hypothetical protein
MSFRAKWQATALNDTCLLTLPADPLTPSSADEFGMGAAFQGIPATVTLACLLLPPTSRIARETGLVLSTPKQLLVADPDVLVETTSRIMYQSQAYEIDSLQRDEGLVLLTLKRA